MCCFTTVTSIRILPKSCSRELLFVGHKGSDREDKINCSSTVHSKCLSSQHLHEGRWHPHPRLSGSPPTEPRRPAQNTREARPPCMTRAPRPANQRSSKVSYDAPPMRPAQKRSSSVAAVLPRLTPRCALRVWRREKRTRFHARILGPNGWCTHRAVARGGCASRSARREGVLHNCARLDRHSRADVFLGRACSRRNPGAHPGAARGNQVLGGRRSVASACGEHRRASLRRRLPGQPPHPLTNQSGSWYKPCPDELPP